MVNILFPISLGLAFGFIYRYLLKLFKAKNIKLRAKNNIGKNDRVVRFVLATVLLLLGYKSMGFVALFASGFCFFEAIFSWCGFYALIGKNTCEI